MLNYLRQPQSCKTHVGCRIFCVLSGVVLTVVKYISSHWYHRKIVGGESNCPTKQAKEPVNFNIQVMSEITGVSEDEIINDFAKFCEQFDFVLIHPYSTVLQFEQNFVYQFLECRNLPFSYFGVILLGSRNYEESEV